MTWKGGNICPGAFCGKGDNRAERKRDHMSFGLEGHLYLGVTRGGAPGGKKNGIIEPSLLGGQGEMGQNEQPIFTKMTFNAKNRKKKKRFKREVTQAE